MLYSFLNFLCLPASRHLAAATFRICDIEGKLVHWELHNPKRQADNAFCWRTEESRPRLSGSCALWCQTNLFTHSKSGHHQLCNLGCTVKVTGCTFGQNRKTQKIYFEQTLVFIVPAVTV